jgi:hypothetical protein
MNIHSLLKYNKIPVKLFMNTRGLQVQMELLKTLLMDQDTKFWLSPGLIFPHITLKCC